ncbi:alpha/beta fold hydrolase [Persicobacter sp. CCB-QB2]|uniref:alpha/beta fold hydrolase n=1 Tax=Persicobacter sp. CCB-QB2 TaxID=1561025 RepID=UPI0006A9E757|nr:alpha/beta hydrolase [Persicobacter sp. CCB-QB2]
MTIEIKEAQGFQYIEEGEGQTIMLLHGLFGALSNWDGVVNHFKEGFRVVIPLLPIYEIPRKQANLEGLLAHIEAFVQMKGLNHMIIMGNSLGGHLALMYALAHPDEVDKLILTGSSGLFENSMGSSFPKRGNYQFIKEKVEYTFYDPKVATKEYVDEVFNITNSIPKCMKIVSIAKSAQRNNLTDELPKIKAKTLLVWGTNDTITPPEVAYDFDRLIPDTQLRFIDRCCHAPMMEHPDVFNQIVDRFLN